MKKQLLKLIKPLEHNVEHHDIDITLFGETHHLCARCTGQYLIGIPAFIIAMILHLQGYLFEFNTIFILSWLLAGLTILDWATVEILKIRKGNNKTRLITGGTLGLGASIYLWLLPTKLSFNLITLLFYFFIMTILIAMVYCKKYNIKPLTLISQNITNAYKVLKNPKYVFTTCTICPCCGSACCPCCATGSCIPLLCCCSCCLLPLICSPFLGGCGICGGKKQQKQ